MTSSSWRGPGSRAGRRRGVVRTRVREHPLTAGRNLRADLLYLRLRDPAQFEWDHAGSRDAPDVGLRTR